MASPGTWPKVSGVVEAAPRLGALIDRAPLAFGLWRLVAAGQSTADAVLEAVNPAFEQLTGRDERELLGRRASELLREAAEDPGPWMEQLWTVERGGEPVQRPYYFAGLRRWYELTLYRAAPGYVASLAIDVSESKHAEAAARTEAREALRRRELQFQALIENVNSGVALVDAAGRFTLYNRRFLELFGLSSDADIRNVNSQDWSAWKVYDERGQLLHVDEHPVRKAALGRTPVRNQLIGVRMPGAKDLAWMLVSAAPLLDHEGAIEHLICTYHDVTEQKRASLALLAGEERLRSANESLSVERGKLEAIIRTLPVGVGITDLTGRTIMMNEAGLRLHGFSSEQEMLAELEQYGAEFEVMELDGRRMPTPDWPASMALRGEFVRERELRLRNARAGTESLVSYTVVPVHDQSAQTVLLVFVMQDISERKQHEAALRPPTPASSRPTCARMSSWPCSRTSCETRWRRSVIACSSSTGRCPGASRPSGRTR